MIIRIGKKNFCCLFTPILLYSYTSYTSHTSLRAFQQFLKVSQRFVHKRTQLFIVEHTGQFFPWIPFYMEVKCPLQNGLPTGWRGQNKITHKILFSVLPACKNGILSSFYQGNRNISEYNGIGINSVPGIYCRVVTGKAS